MRTHGRSGAPRPGPRSDTKADLPGVEGKEVLVTLLEAAPGAEFPTHTHPGDEFLYVIDGSIEGFVEQTRNPVQTGEAKLLAIHIVDKGKPLTTPAKP